MTSAVYGQIREGMQVYSSDDDSLGRIVEVTAHGFVVEKGSFFPRDYEISYEAIASVEGDDVHLHQTVDQLRRLDFTEAGIPSAPQPQATNTSLKEDLEKEFQENPLSSPFRR